MALEPFFSLTPSIPDVYTYDPANPDAPYVHAQLCSNGGVTYPSYSWSLSDQLSKDEIILGGITTDANDQVLDSVDDFSGAYASIIIDAQNVSTNNQYILIIALNGYWSTTAQIFVDFDHKKSVGILRDEQIALVMDVPTRRDVSGIGPSNFNLIMVRCASHQPGGAVMGFKGLTCYYV